MARDRQSTNTSFTRSSTPFPRRWCGSLVVAAAALAIAAPAGADPFTSWFAHVLINETETGPRMAVGDYGSNGTSGQTASAVRLDARDDILNASYSLSATQHASASATSLKASTWLDYDLELGWESLRARAATFADFYDTVTVQHGTALPGTYALEFDWDMDGGFSSRMTSVSGAPGYPVFPIHFMRYQYITSAELSVSWNSPSLPVTNTRQAYTNEMFRISDSLSLDPFARDASEFLRRGFTASDIFGVEEVLDEYIEGRTISVTVPVGIDWTVDLGFHLQATTNLMLGNLDFSGGLNGSVISDFAHTATLKAVRLVDANGTPVTGDWSLLSGSGAAYPVQHVQGAPVPEPQSLALLALALPLVMRRRSARCH